MLRQNTSTYENMFVIENFKNKYYLLYNFLHTRSCMNFISLLYFFIVPVFFHYQINLFVCYTTQIIFQTFKDTKNKFVVKQQRKAN